jgi:hypothetical protein
MPTNTTFKPLNDSEFNSGAMQINMQAVQGSVSPGEYTNIDLLLIEDHLLQGVAKLFVYNADKDDTIHLQVIHPVYGVVNQFATGLYINPQIVDQDIFIPNYTAKLPAGLSIRLVYLAANSGTTRSIKINWLLHKVLV